MVQFTQVVTALVAPICAVGIRMDAVDENMSPEQVELQLTISHEEEIADIKETTLAVKSKILEFRNRLNDMKEESSKKQVRIANESAQIVIDEVEAERAAEEKRLEREHEIEKLAMQQTEALGRLFGGFPRTPPPAQSEGAPQAEAQAQPPAPPASF